MCMKYVDLSQYDNGWFRIGAGRLKTITWFFVNAWLMQGRWNPSSSLKVRLLRMFGAKIGHGVIIKPSVNIKYPWNLVVGDYTWIGENVWIDNLTQVTMGRNVCISQGAMLLCGNHNYRKTTFDLMIGSITLEDGVWVGAQSVVCPGVRMASHSVLTVGSVATRDCEEYGIYQGNPAVKVKVRIIE